MFCIDIPACASRLSPRSIVNTFVPTLLVLSMGLGSGCTGSKKFTCCYPLSFFIMTMDDILWIHIFPVLGI